MEDIDYSTLANSELLVLAKKAAADMHNTLPKELYLGSFTLQSKLPWKGTLFRELLLHRFSDFLDTTLELYEADRIIPAFVLTRAIMENTAMMYWLCTKATEFTQNYEGYVRRQTARVP
jgi:hypothetical protein